MKFANLSWWNGWRIAGVLAAVIAGAGGIYFYVWDKEREAALIRQREAARAEEREAARAERARCASAAKDLRSALVVWRDAVALASATPRIALAGPIAALQKQSYDVKALALPACAAGAQHALNDAMRYMVDEFIGFMADPDARLDRKAIRQEFHEFEREVSALEGCDPACWAEREARREQARQELEKQLLASRLAEEKRKQEEFQRYRAEQRENLIKSRLDDVRRTLHNPKSVEFRDVIYNDKTDAVCGYLSAINGVGKLVTDQAFAADSRAVAVGVDPRGINTGGHAAERLCGMQVAPQYTVKGR